MPIMRAAPTSNSQGPPCGASFGFLLSCSSARRTGPDGPGGGAAGRAWIEQSNAFTNQLLNVQFQHNPESGSHEGLAEFDTRISTPTLADELAEREQLSGGAGQDRGLARRRCPTSACCQDLDILAKAFDLKFRKQDFALKHEVPFLNASEITFQGLHVLLDDQVAAERRPAALVRLRKYAGDEPGYQPFTELLKARELEQIAKPGVIYPSRGEIETELGRNATYLEGIAALFRKYRHPGLGGAVCQAQATAGGLRRVGAPGHSSQGTHRLPHAAGALRTGLRGVRH